MLTYTNIHRQMLIKCLNNTKCTLLGLRYRQFLDANLNSSPSQISRSNSNLKHIYRIKPRLCSINLKAMLSLSS